MKKILIFIVLAFSVLCLVSCNHNNNKEGALEEKPNSVVKEDEGLSFYKWFKNGFFDLSRNQILYANSNDNRVTLFDYDYNNDIAVLNPVFLINYKNYDIKWNIYYVSKNSLLVDYHSYNTEKDYVLGSCPKENLLSNVLNSVLTTEIDEYILTNYKEIKLIKNNHISIKIDNEEYAFIYDAISNIYEIKGNLWGEIGKNGSVCKRIVPYLSEDIIIPENINQKPVDKIPS